MAVNYKTTDSNGHKVGDMICDKCGEKIEDNTCFLIEERYNIRDRGNENDETYIYHRECTTLVAEWKKYDIRMTNIKEDERLRENKRKEIIESIAEYNFSQWELF